MHLFWNFSNAATLERRLHNQSWSTSYPLWAGDNPGPEIESCPIKKMFIPSEYLFSFLLFLSIAWISSESDFLRVVLFPRVCFAPHWVFQRICILNTMHSIDRIYQHDMHSEDSNHIFPSWHPTWKSFALFLRGLRTDVHGQLFARLRRISCRPFGVEMFQDIRCWGITKWKWKTLRLKPFFGMGLLTIISYLINMIKKFLNTKKLLNFQKESSPGPQCILTQCRHRWKRAGL